MSSVRIEFHIIFPFKLSAVSTQCEILGDSGMLDEIKKYKCENDMICTYSTFVLGLTFEVKGPIELKERQK